MMTTRSRNRMASPSVAALALAAFAIAPVAAIAAVNDPAGTLSSYNDGVVAVMKAGLGTPARVARFETLVKTHYDMPAIAALVVGPKWAAASPADRTAAITALTRHSAVSLARNFTGFGGEKFITDPNVAARGTSSIVKVTIASKDGTNVLQYRLRQNGGDWRIIDVVADGVSQLALQRAELATTIASEGVAGMAKKLAARDANLEK
jgi:phospholipid transport system substrate-binding protein